MWRCQTGAVDYWRAPPISGFARRPLIGNFGQLSRHQYSVEASVEPPDDAARAVDAQPEQPVPVRDAARQVLTWAVVVLVIMAIVIMTWSILDSGPASAPSPSESPTTVADSAESD